MLLCCKCVTKFIKLNPELGHNLCSVLVGLSFTNFNGSVTAAHVGIQGNLRGFSVITKILSVQ